MGRFLDISVPNEPHRSPGDFCLADPPGDTDMAYSFDAEDLPADPALAEIQSEIPLRFTPIDHNPDFEQLEQNRNKRCDGYLRSEDTSTLIFTELKNREVGKYSNTKSWIEKAIVQLRQTIAVFRREEPEKAQLSKNGCHWAYVCNPKGPYQVPESVRSVKKMFLTATRNFTLYCNNRINVKMANTPLFILDFPGTAVITDDGRAVSYAELKQLTEAWHPEIASRSLVFLLVANNLDSLVAYVACLNRGVVPLMLDAKIDAELLARFVDTYAPSYVVNCVSGEVGKWGSGEVGKWGSGEVGKWGSGEVGKWGSGEDPNSPTSQPPNLPTSQLFPDLALLLTTSGSTGSPKLVRQSYANIKANTESIVEYLHLDSTERPITTLPMNYTYGLSILNSHLYVGATILLTSASIMQREFWDFFTREGATSFGGVPYTYEMLDKLMFFRRKLPSLRTMTQAGGKILPPLHKKFAEYAAKEGKHFVVMYGQCEATARMSYLPPERALDKVGSMGIAIPGGRFKLIGDDGEEVGKLGSEEVGKLGSEEVGKCPTSQPPNLPTPQLPNFSPVGELVYEGANVTLGYAECAADLAKGDERHGVLVTGDMAKRDADGFYYIVGRKKRFLKIFGNRVNLDETERLIKSHFTDIDLACSGKDDHMVIFVEKLGSGEVGKSKSSQLPNCPTSPLDEIKQFVAEKTHLNFTAFDVRPIDKIPKNDAGKTLYKELPA